jgi:L-aspartate oxidase
VEFVQFHPTALHHPQMPRPLLSEALRGHGALLRDAKGERFVDELLPRDEVSRAMTRRMLEQGVDHLWLDATGLESFDERFPTISAALRPAGLDPAVDWLPIAPAAHYFGGGVVTDLDGAASLPGLWAAGEVSCSGVHGANRLASNSLLEGMVFGTRVVEAIEAGRTSARSTGAMRAVLEGGAVEAPTIGGTLAEGWRSGRPLLDDSAADRSGVALLEGCDEAVAVADVLASARDRMQRAMTTGAGVLRSAESLATTTAVLRELESGLPAVVGRPDPSRATDRAGLTTVAELANLVEVGRALLAVATLRHESRGAHTRSDFPDTDPAFRCRIVLGRS